MPAPADFHDVLLPIYIAPEHDAEGGFKTTVHRMFSGHEVRIVQTEDMLQRWEISYNNNTQAAIEVAVHFGIGRRGKRFSFRFLDPRDHRHDSAILGASTGIQHEATFYDTNGAAIFYTATGGETSLQLKKPMGDATNPYYKPITKPVDSSVYTEILDYDGNSIATPTFVLYKNEVALTGGGVDYTMDFNSGEITGLTGVIASDSFSWDGAFHKHVRMDVELGKLVSMAGLLASNNIDAHRIPSLPLVELFD